MPKLPRIMPSGNQLTTQQPNAMQRDIGFGAKAVQAIGNEISNYGDMFQKANMLAEKTKAQNSIDAKLDDIHSRAEQDPDISDKRRLEYDAEIKRATAESSAFITLPQERALFNLESGSRGNIVKNRVDRNFWKRNNDVHKQDMDAYLNKRKDDFIRAAGAPEKQMAVIEYDNKLAEMVNAGHISEADSRKLKEFRKKDWSKSQVNYDIMRNPEMAKELLETNAYSDVDEEDRVDMLKDANEIIEKNRIIGEKQVKVNQIKMKDEATGKLFDRTLTLNDIKDYVNAGMPASDGLALRTSLLAPIAVDPVKASVNFDKFQKRFNDFEISKKEKTGASFDDLINFRSDVLKAMSKGEIEESDGKRFYREVALAYNIKEDEHAIQEAKKENGWFRNFTNAITFWADENAPQVAETKARLQREFIDRVSNGEEGPDVYEDVINREKDRNHPKRKNFTKGQNVVRQGRTYVYLEDNDAGEPTFRLVK